MNTHLFAFAIIAIIGYIISRGFIELNIINYFSAKKYKSYKKQTSFSQRYWLVWILKKSQAKYLKSERRIIDYPAIIVVYFYTHIVIFVSLLATLLLAFLATIGVIDIKCAEIAITLYLIEILLSFVVYYFINNYEKYEYHRKRNKK